MSFPSHLCRLAVAHWFGIAALIAMSLPLNQAAAEVQPPTITTQPADSSGEYGSFASLHVVADGAVSYQWYRGPAGDVTSPVTNATGASLLVTRRALSSYWVRVTNEQGSMDSRTASISLNPPAPLATFYDVPSDQILPPGQQATLTVRVGYAAQLQWYRGRAGDTSEPVSGALVFGMHGGMASTLNYTPTTSAQFWVRASNDTGSKNSRTMTFLLQGEVPTIVTQPADAYLPSGGAYALSVVTRGLPVIHQWYEGNSGDTSHPTGSGAGATLQGDVSATTSAQEKRFWVRVAYQAMPLVFIDSRTATVRVPALALPDDLVLEATPRISGGASAPPFGDKVITLRGSIGSGSVIEWLRDGVPLPGVTGTSFNATPSDGSFVGAYTVRVTDGSVVRTSNAVPINWVDLTGWMDVTPERATAGFEISAAGPSLTFQWLDKNHQPLQDSAHYSGTRTRSLRIIGMKPTDVGSYYCRVTNGFETGIKACYLNMAGKPVPAIMTSDRGFVVGRRMDGEGIVWSAVEGSGFKVVSISGLPPGMKFVSATSQLIGTPTSAGRFLVKIQARNSYGLGPVTTVELVVRGLPDSQVGTFNGLVERDPAVNGGLGGSFTLTTTSSATFSGALTTGAVSRRFSGTLVNENGPSGTGNVVLASSRGVPSLTLTFTLNDDATLTGSLITPTAQASVRAVRSPWVNGIQAVHHMGIHIAALPIDSPWVGNLNYPQGTGYFGGGVSLSGVFTAGARFADNTVATVAATIGQDGSIPIHWMLYNGTGSAQGWASSDGKVMAGSVSWVKQPQPTNSTTRSYKAGFPLHSLSIRGGRMRTYAASDMVLGWQPSGGNVVVSFEDTVFTGTITKAAPLLMPAGSPFALSVNRDQNKFGGLVSINGRKGDCYGVFVDQIGMGVGSVQMPVSTQRNAALLSENVVISPVR